jgi:Uncharacterized protein conserved in bacteria
MKLVFAIVSNDDGANVISELNRNQFSVTKLCSTGGFLRSGNTTLLVGVDEEKVDAVIKIIEKKSKSREIVMSTSVPSGDFVGIPPYPMEVTVGGGTIFVLDVERFVKV